MNRLFTLKFAILALMSTLSVDTGWAQSAVPSIAPALPLGGTKIPAAPPAPAAAPATPHFILSVPLRLTGLPRNADVASVACTTIAVMGSVSVVVDTPIPPPADAAQTTLRQLVTTVQVPFTFPGNPDSLALTNSANYQCELSVKQGLDPQTQLVLAPSPRGRNPPQAKFPLALNSVMKISTAGAYPTVPIQ